MIIQFHVSRQKGIYLLSQGFSVDRQTHSAVITVDSETISDAGLAKLGVTRQALNDLVPRDLVAELDELKVIVNDLVAKGG